MLRSMRASAPYARLILTLRSSSARRGKSRDVPMLTLTLVLRPWPMPAGRAGEWLGLKGMTTRPRATSPASVSAAIAFGRGDLLQDRGEDTFPCFFGLRHDGRRRCKEEIQV